MPLKSIIRRRLLSLLQPWLREEPQLDLELGFLHSLAVAKNLRFDVSVLNHLFDFPPLLSFKDLTVERLIVRFSTWCPPAFTIEVHGVRVVLSFEKPEEEECARRLRLRTSKYDYSDYLRKRLSALDPEGCTLHHILERILFAVPERKDFVTSFLNLILKNCHLDVHHIHVEVQFPILNDEFMCFGEIKEFTARSKYQDQRCLFRELAVSLSPDDISVCLLFDKLLSEKSNHTRSARELWRIASSRIGHVTVTPRLSLQRLVGVIGQWIHYVNAYENILLLIGYSTGHIWKKSISKMSHNKLVFSSARHHWELISDIEKKLPVEGISLARRIARHRAALKVPFDCHEEFVATISVKDIFEQRVFLSCGQMKVELAPLTMTAEASTMNTLSSAKGNGKEDNAWAKRYECFSKELILALLQKLPEKYIHFVVFVDGPSVRFSQRREAKLGRQDINHIISQDNFDLTFDFHEIEVVVGSPPSLFGMASLTSQLGLGNAKAECITLEPRVIEIPKPINDKYASLGKISIGSYLHLNGLNACLEKSAEDHQIQLFILKPITVQILSFR
ncbi:hypothetical protein SESBI_04154 [Sesbania bispinosa]|nr:hypothetical protein SESBI_04154 [Sesbania bispinosa]